MSNEDIVYGKNSVESLLDSDDRSINKIFISKGLNFDSKLKKIIQTAKNRNIIVQEVPKEKLNALVQEGHQGIIAMVSPVEYKDFDDFIAELNTEKNSLVIILDGVEDPHNLGAIIRTAVCAGADGIIIPKRRASQVNATVEKTSAGAVSHIPIIQVGNLNKTIEKLKENRFWVIGAEADGKDNYFDIKYDMNCALVLGGENQGVSNLVKKNCDILVKIPMLSDFNSLNVSNAASILIYEVVRQKFKK